MRFIIFALACLMSAIHSIAQDAAGETSVDLWNSFYAQRVAQYEMTSDGGAAEIQLDPKPLLTYTNPVRGRDQQGAVYAWTLRTQSATQDPNLVSRPVVLGTIWSIANMRDQPGRRTAHEIHSLMSSPLKVECPAVNDPDATRANAVSWNLESIDASLRLSLDSSQAPAKTNLRRLIQMRRLAGDLSAVTIDRQDNAERPLRLMTSPLMRYESPSTGVMDGCVFAFVQATDPELLVLIEAIEDADAKEGVSWRAIPARFTGTEIRLSQGAKEIWRCEKIDYANQTGPYRLRIGVSELPDK